MRDIIDCFALPTAEEMRHLDKKAIALGIPENVLMENAAREAFTVLQEMQFPLKNKYILLFMGSGNNGGDAAALARHVLDAYAHPLVLHTKPLNKYKGAAGQHMRIAKACGVKFVYVGKGKWQKNIPHEWRKPHIIVDGLLGTGFSGELNKQFANFIEYINEQQENSFIFSLDIPSGCHAVSGKPMPIAVKAHATVCFAAAKPGLVLPENKGFVGKLFVRQIGLPRCVLEQNPPSYGMLKGHFFAEFLQDIPANSHKNSFGHALILGGSQGLTGAAHLAARAALRSGAGLVSVAAPQGLCAEIKGQNPDMMTILLGDGYAWPSTIPQNLYDKLEQAHALALGPGMGTDDKALTFLHTLLSLPERPRTVLDADALTLLAANQDLLALLREDDVLTPHPGEAARFFGTSSADIQRDRFAAMAQLTRLAPVTWLLKGAGTLIANVHSAVYVLPRDIPTLAVAGSGDVLTGCISAWLARLPDVSSLKLTALAACIHTEAGLILEKSFPARGHTASDIAQVLPFAMEKLQIAEPINEGTVCEALL